MSTPLRDLLHDLLFDAPARAAFAAAPEQYLDEHGWDGLRGQDVEAALDALSDELPPDQAARIAPLVADDGAYVGTFADGLGGAIAGLEAATSAIDGELPAPVAEPIDPSSTLDRAEPDGRVDVDSRGDLDDLDDRGDFDAGDLDDGDTDGAHEATTLELDALSFGTSTVPAAAEADLDGAPETPADAGSDQTTGIDFGEELAPGDTSAAGPWGQSPDESPLDADETDDDVID
jgi:hypothetical protein